MKRFLPFTCLFLLFFTQIVNAQPSNGNLQQALYDYTARMPIEKVYIHHDRTDYYAGETVWMKIYQTSSANASAASQIVYADLIDPQQNAVLQTRWKLKDGRAEACLELPEDLPAGHYQLRAYTRWMQNFAPEGFFHQELTVYGPQPSGEDANDKEDTAIRFFPEGGWMIEGLTNRVAFEITGRYAEDIKEIFITNEKEDTVAIASPSLHGKGLFSFLPQPGMRYEAHLPNIRQTYPLPQCKERGFALSTEHRDGKFRIRMAHNLTEKEASAHQWFIVLHREGELIVEVPIDTRNKIGLISFPIDELPAGTFTVSLIDESYQAWWERLAFVRFPEQLNLLIRTKHEKQNGHKSVKLILHSTDRNGHPQPGAFSLAAVDATLEQTSKRSNLTSYLFLGSELQGNLRYLPDYWNPARPDAMERINLLLLTQGWRRYELELLTETPQPPSFPMELGLSLSGKVDVLGNKKLKDITIEAILRQDSLREYAELKPDEKKRFVLDGIEFTGTKDVILTARDKKEKAYPIVLDVPHSSPAGHYRPTPFDAKQSFATAWKVNRYIEPRIGKTPILLGEVEITAQKTDPMEKRRTYGAGFVKNAVNIEANTASGRVIDYLRRVPGISMIYGGDPAYPMIPHVNGTPGKTPASIVLDGSLQRMPEFVFDMDISQIERIEVLQPTATMFGGFNTGGVICLYRRPVGGEKETTRQAVCQWIGYNQAKTFYLPAATDNDFFNLPQARNTYYWNPTVTTGADGRAEISFFLNERENKKITVHCEGISTNGITGVYSQTIR